jgi:peptide-methionine (R)-S-oxide reductase
MKQINPNLNAEQKRILFEKGTEAPGSGKYLHMNDEGQFMCANCDNPIFASSAKYDSATPGLIGWPSFDTAIDGSVTEIDDFSMGMQRTEVVCANCGGHLGHVFPADDATTGMHYCINSASLGFTPTD